jgi:DNA-binding GntR family transcriptional regulator
MSEPKMMKIKSDVKERIEKLKTKFSASSESDVVQRLLEYYEKSASHVELTDEAMAALKKQKEYLRVSSEADVIQIQNHHFDLALSYPITVFEMIQKHQKYSRW